MAGKAAQGSGKTAPVIIIRRDEGEEAAHHGGAWKVAYADFVTAMMAFFLLMWLLNATTEEQRTGLADYFAPTNLFGRSASGSGQPFGGKTPNDAGTSVSSNGAPQTIMGKRPLQPDVEEDDTDTPAMPAAGTPTQPNARAMEAPDESKAPREGKVDGTSAAETPQAGHGRSALTEGGDYSAPRLIPVANANQSTNQGANQAADQANPAPNPAADAAQQNLAQQNLAQQNLAQQNAGLRNDVQREDRALEMAGTQLLEAIRRDPALQDAKGQLMIENVPEGLRIQVVDAERRPMFALGGATPTKQVRELMQKVVPALAGLPNEISISGHTDSLTYRGQDKDNWELSSDRANATRRILVEAGLDGGRIRRVTGNADRDLLVPADPLSPANRRITIIVLRHAVPEQPADGKPRPGGSAP